MAENHNDPLKALLSQQAAIEKGESPEAVVEEDDSKLDSIFDEIKKINSDEKEEIEYDYGDDDLEDEIAAEEAEEKRLRQEKADALIAAKKERDSKRLPAAPDERDMAYHNEAIDYQADKLNIVSGMVNRVVAKYRIISGGIPEEVVKNESTGEIVSYGKRAVMGELIDIYHNSGEKITPAFENIILNNWIMPDGTVAAKNINEDGIVIDKTMFDKPDANKKKNADDDDDDEVASIDDDKNIGKGVKTINITVDRDIQETNPVTVNIDKDIVAKTGTAKEVNVVVREVTEKDLMKATVYKNSEKTGIINVYDSGLNDVPVTLPLSGYRCVMRSVNWFDFISLTAPSTNNNADTELKKWSVIYKHIKNPSIGDFENFEDFLKKTKYQDRELLMWAILVATSDEEEHITVTCGNPNCKAKNRIPYHPRTITKTDKELEPAWYYRAAEAAPGDEARAVWEEANNRHTRYLLPNSKIIVEISEPSAYDFINTKLKLVSDLYKRYRPNDVDMKNFRTDDLSMVEFEYLSANALYIESLTIIPTDDDGNQLTDKKGNKIEYCYTNWDKIEEIITHCLDGEDSAILLKIIQQSQEKISPISFRVENVACPECGRVEPFIPIEDIGQQLLFQLSRRFGDIKVNLTKMATK